MLQKILRRNTCNACAYFFLIYSWQFLEVTSISQISKQISKWDSSMVFSYFLMQSHLWIYQISKVYIFEKNFAHAFEFLRATQIWYCVSLWRFTNCWDYFRNFRKHTNQNFQQLENSWSKYYKFKLLEIFELARQAYQYWSFWVIYVLSEKNKMFFKNQFFCGSAIKNSLTQNRILDVPRHRKRDHSNIFFLTLF